jgi:hypothetical protein
MKHQIFLEWLILKNYTSRITPRGKENKAVCKLIHLFSWRRPYGMQWTTSTDILLAFFSHTGCMNLACFKAKLWLGCVDTVCCNVGSDVLRMFSECSTVLIHHFLLYLNLSISDKTGFLNPNFSYSKLTYFILTSSLLIFSTSFLNGSWN